LFTALSRIPMTASAHGGETDETNRKVGMDRIFDGVRSWPIHHEVLQLRKVQGQGHRSTPLLFLWRHKQLWPLGGATAMTIWDWADKHWFLTGFVLVVLTLGLFDFLTNYHRRPK
jgi:hypothetical protein